jgi:formate dehydrogenase alpha subunit
MAHIVLPGAAFSEKGGSFTNMEGRIQSFQPVVAPPGEAKPDSEILDLLFAKMGYPKRHSSLGEIRAEMSDLVPLYSALKGNGEQTWIEKSSNSQPFHGQGKGEPIRFSPVIKTEPERSNEDYPLRAVLGSLRYHLGSGTRTGHSGRIKDFALKGEVEIAPEDGAALKLEEGDQVRISSAHGSISREVKLKTDLRPGLIFVPTAFHHNDVMNLIELTQLGEANSPGWKECRVKVEKMEN